MNDHRVSIEPPQNRNYIGNDPVERCTETTYLLRIIMDVISNDPRVRIITCLANKQDEFFSVRKIALCVNLAPKNLVKYLEELRRNGIVEIAYETPKLKLYRLNPRFKFVINLLRAQVEGYERNGLGS